MYFSPQAMKKLFIIFTPSCMILLVYVHTRSVFRIAVGSWRLEIGRDLRFLPSEGGAFLTAKQNDTLDKLDYAMYRKGRVKTGGGEGAGEETNRTIDCFGIIEGRRESLERAKSVQKSLEAPIDVSLLAEAFRSQFSACDVCDEEIRRGNPYIIDGHVKNPDVKDGHASNHANSHANIHATNRTRTVDACDANLSLFCASECDAILTRARFPVKIGRKPAEKEFSLAVAVFVFGEHPEQVYRFLRSVYRPWNSYCIHVDKKANHQAFEFYSSLGRCLPNVFLAEERVDGIYASYTRLEAEFACMRTMIKSGDWKYYINFAGSEMPLRTNEEMVRILRRYDEQNDIEGIVPGSGLANRWKFSWKVEGKPPNIKQSSTEKSSAPHGLTIVKGSAYAAFTRKFVAFALEDQKAKDLFEWSKDTYSPDEFFWSTLQYNPSLNVPGVSKKAADRRTWKMKYSIWDVKKPACYGSNRNGICIFGIEDLQNIVHLNWFALNKFDLAKSRSAFECHEEWHLNRTLVQESFPIDMAAYPLSSGRK